MLTGKGDQARGRWQMISGEAWQFAAISAGVLGLLFISFNLKLPITVRRRARIAAPPEAVWALVDLVPGRPGWHPDIEAVDVLDSNGDQVRCRHRLIRSDGSAFAWTVDLDIVHRQAGHRLVARRMGAVALEGADRLLGIMTTAYGALLAAHGAVLAFAPVLMA
jgi:hypothetical protein